MKQYTFLIACSIIGSIVFTSSCKKIDGPRPEGQELITTVRLNISNAKGFNKTFNYKVENGFENGTPGMVTKDSLILDTNTSYNVELLLLNEKQNPVENITKEVIEEKDEHLFIYESNPVEGAGAIAVTEGNTDNKGKPFNQTVKFKTTAAGTGTLTITLKHEPTNKDAKTAQAAGGDTDMQAVFNVRVN